MAINRMLGLGIPDSVAAVAVLARNRGRINAKALNRIFMEFSMNIKPY
jgi:hypothetical protein